MTDFPPETIGYVDTIVTHHKQVGRDIAEMLFLVESGMPEDTPNAVSEKMWSTALDEIRSGVHRASRSHQLTEPEMLEHLVTLTSRAFFDRFDELCDGSLGHEGGRA